MTIAKELAVECASASDELESLVEKFEVVGWKDHASYIQTMASHLRIYAHQLERKAAQGDAL